RVRRHGDEADARQGQPQARERAVAAPARVGRRLTPRRRAQAPRAVSAGASESGAPSRKITRRPEVDGARWPGTITPTRLRGSAAERSTTVPEAPAACTRR